MSKIRKHVWVDSNLALMLDDKGIDLSAFLHLALTGFLEVPEDPTIKLLREGIPKSLDRVRAGYINAIRSRSGELEQAQTKEDIEKAKQKELIARIEKFGEKLQNVSCYARCIAALKTMDPEAHCWDIALRELNSMNGSTYTFDEMWSTAIEWYRKCPVPQS
jgi:hypothetical protein